MIPNIQTGATAPGDKLFDLSIIGVPEASQQKIPGISSYPSKFEPTARSVWDAHVSTDEFKRWARANNLDQVWHDTIRKFLLLCEQEGVMPFKNSTDLTKNEYLVDAFTRSRIALVHWIDEVQIFSRIKVKKAHREYVRNEKGLTIRSWAELYPVKDLGFEEWLRKAPSPRFTKYPDGRWTKMVAPNITVWVKIVGPARTTFGYEIKMNGQVAVPKKDTPTKKQVNDFIDKQIWYPIVRAHRIDLVRNRLF